jgi:hypothetical protein
MLRRAGDGIFHGRVSVVPRHNEQVEAIFGTHTVLFDRAPCLDDGQYEID